MLLNKWYRAMLLIILVMLLMFVRIAENQLFYDPFIAFFKEEYFALHFPEINTNRLLLNYIFRYAINSILSLSIVYLLFKDLTMVKFSATLLGVFLAVLLVLFFAIFYLFGEQQMLLLFYVRRFIIQPIFVLLFIPAFYFQHLSAKK